jgi:hypothetical protein
MGGTIVGVDLNEDSVHTQTPVVMTVIDSETFKTVNAG